MALGSGAVLPSWTLCLDTALLILTVAGPLGLWPLNGDPNNALREDDISQVPVI